MLSYIDLQFDEPRLEQDGFPLQLIRCQVANIVDTGYREYVVALGDFVHADAKYKVAVLAARYATDRRWVEKLEAGAPHIIVGIRLLQADHPIEEHLIRGDGSIFDTLDTPAEHEANYVSSEDWRYFIGSARNPQYS